MMMISSFMGANNFAMHYFNEVVLFKSSRSNNDNFIREMYANVLTALALN